MWGHRSTDRRKQILATNCIAAMDIVFLIDYTGSMSSSINMVKQSIASLLETIEIESNNDYRLSLILFDEYTTSYINKPAYTSLPADQKIVQGNVYITVLNKLSQNNYAETIDKLNILTTDDFPLGNGGGLPEPSDFALKKVLYDSIAGTFRQGVNKSIIIFTDEGPSGLNDSYSIPEDFIEMMNLAKFSRDNGITVSTNYMTSTDSYYDRVYTTIAKITNGVFASGNGNIQVLKDLITNMCDNIASQKPVVSTTSVSNISSSGWTVSGNVTSAGTQPVTERGFLYSVNSTNVLENEAGVTKVVNGSGPGSYTNNISQSVGSGQTFYVRAYAKSVVGISYGDKLRVSTSPATAPSVNINSVNVISGKLNASGTINSDGGSTLTERGFIYSTSNGNLTIGQSGVTKVIVPGLFSNYSMETPVTGTDYYVRSYAINSVGTSYSSIMSTATTTTTTTVLQTRAILIGLQLLYDTATLYAYKNGTSYLSVSSATSSSGTIQVGDTFYGRLDKSSMATASLEVVSTTRGMLYGVYDSLTNLTSGTYTVQSGEDIYIYGTVKEGGCLVAGTLVTLVDGTNVPVESLNTGDQLLSAQIVGLEDTNNVLDLKQWSSAEIEKGPASSSILEFVRETAPFTISLNDGLLTASSSHIQLVKRDNTWRFLRFGEIIVGDMLLLEDTTEVEITTISVNVEATQVYRIVLDTPSHTYYANNILTHNIT